MGAVPGRTTLVPLGSGTYGPHLTLRRQRISRQTTHGGPVTHSPTFVVPAKAGSRLASADRCRGRRCLTAPRVDDKATDSPEGPQVDEKHKLRAAMRAERREHVAALPDSMRALLFLRPPGPVAALAPEGAMVGLYHALPNEAPTRAYAKWFFENGRGIALPWFAGRDAPMRFRRWRDPYADGELEPGPHGHLQPAADAEEVAPEVVLVPLLAFTARGDRLGQGGGHYDRWLAANPEALPIGLAWDCQLAPSLPREAHDCPLRAVVTPTRFYQGEG